VVKYLVAERFKSIQGEGVYAGKPMAFIRFVGCSVGKRICQHCDTDFDKPYGWLGGGEYTAEQLAEWSYPYDTICLTGGEPLDQDLEELVERLYYVNIHVETSGTRPIPRLGHKPWVCVSPKPGFKEEIVERADEIKVIVPGLGTEESLIKMYRESPTGDPDNEKPATFRWPTLEDAIRWADSGTPVFLQPRNAKFDVDKMQLSLVQELVLQHPKLRLSTQMHKLLRVR
jgi:organic radical activating enzyme